MNYKLSLLIPTRETDWPLVDTLMKEIRSQDKNNEVEILTLMNRGEHSIGYYRNTLVEWAHAPYLAFIDSDDMITKEYVSTLLEAIKFTPDVVSLRGVITIDGGKPEVFEHSIKYNEWRTTNNFIKYERMPNHLNCVKSSIAKQIKYPEINHGEDWEYSKVLQASNLVKTECYTDQMLYQYLYKTKK